ncbi:MAG: response regulator [Pseudomonadota bacterium]
MKSFAGKTVLVVDDDVDLCDIIADELADAGFTVEKAFSGNQAIKALEKKAFDLVLTDIKMPEGSGIDLLKFIRQKSTSTPVVLMMTGFVDFSESDLISMGAKVIFRKPVLVEKMLAQLETIF